MNLFILYRATRIRTLRLRCRASRQAADCASTSAVFLEERANDGVRVLIRNALKCLIYMGLRHTIVSIFTYEITYPSEFGLT